MSPHECSEHNPPWLNSYSRSSQQQVPFSNFHVRQVTQTPEPRQASQQELVSLCPLTATVMGSPGDCWSVNVTCAILLSLLVVSTAQLTSATSSKVSENQSECWAFTPRRSSQTTDAAYLYLSPWLTGGRVVCVGTASVHHPSDGLTEQYARESTVTARPTHFQCLKWSLVISKTMVFPPLTPTPPFPLPPPHPPTPLPPSSSISLHSSPFFVNAVTYMLLLKRAWGKYANLSSWKRDSPCSDWKYVNCRSNSGVV